MTTRATIGQGTPRIRAAHLGKLAKPRTGRGAAQRTRGPAPDGGTRLYASKLEAAFAQKLAVLHGEAKIVAWVAQRRFELYAGDSTQNGKPVEVCVYVADFQVRYPDGSHEVFECKGWWEPVAKLKRRWFEAQHPNIPLRIITKADL